MSDKLTKCAPSTPSTRRKRAKDQYVRGLLIRGEAAKAVDGVLPPGATHEIVEEHDDDVPTVRRRRFSAV
jgi:hypothetical protein